jgi:hypothetical protein
VPLNWDRIANEFADHEAATDRANERLKRLYQREIKEVRHLVQEVTLNVPTAVKNHLERHRKEGRHPGEWVMIWHWKGGDEVGLSVASTMESKLHDAKVRTKQEVGGDELYTGHELYAHLEDLKVAARKHINRPPFQVGQGPQMPGKNEK